MPASTTCLDALASNQLGRAFYCPRSRPANQAVNFASFVFLDEHWATHNVRLHNRGEKVFNHPVVGELDLSYDRFELPASTRGARSGAN